MKVPLSINLDMVLNDPGAWEPFRDGIEVHWLYRSDDDAPAAALLKYEPGAQVPRHEHVGYEHILVLRGAQEDEHGIHNAGELTINPPGTAHSVASPEGCVVYAVWEKPPRFVT